MKKKSNIELYLDSIDFISGNTGLNNFLVPNCTEFKSLRDLIDYSFKEVPEDSIEAYAHVHSINNKHLDILLFKIQDNGTIKYFEFK